MVIRATFEMKNLELLSVVIVHVPRPVSWLHCNAIVARSPGWLRLRKLGQQHSQS